MFDIMWVMVSQTEQQEREKRFKEAYRHNRFNSEPENNTSVIRAITRILHIF